MQPTDPTHGDVAQSLAMHRSRRDELQITPQNLIEFWVVSTRPVANNGLGLGIAQAEAEIASLKRVFALLTDTHEVFAEWERVVVRYQVLGKQAHDVLLVASMLVHGVTHLLTFNDSDFKRFTEITVLNPNSLLDETQSGK